jgi:type IV fimbrial biogenesis protein FimT
MTPLIPSSLLHRPPAGLQSRQSPGFTIIELMITVVILTILIAVAAPSMSNLVKDQRVKTAAGDLYAALVFARSESIKRNQFIAICAMTDDGWGCQNSADWARGWIVYLDPDGNGFPDAVADVLKRQDSLSDVAITGTAGNVSYQGDGRLRATATPFVVSISGNNAITARCVRLDPSGRPNVKVDTDKDPSNGCN